MVRAMGAAPTCSCSRSRRLTVRLRSEELPSALNPASGHYFDRARSLPAHQVQLGEMVEYQGIAPCIPVWKTGVYLSTPMLGEMESRVSIALTCAVLQTAAWAARPTRHLKMSGRRAWPPPAYSDTARHQCRRFRGSHRLASFSNSFLVLIREASRRSFALPKAVANRPSTPTLSINPNSFRTDASIGRPANSFTGRNSLIACRTRT